MHGRVKKDVVEPTAEEKEKQKQQVKKARELFGKLLELRQAKAYSAQTLEMTTTALGFHPEFPTMWGYRREILQSGVVDVDRKQMLETEMRLLEKALRKSQKVYSIWFHRRWVVEQLFKTITSAADARRVLDVELELCGRLLEVDERNFHCWNHRAFVMGMMLQQQMHQQAAAKSSTSSEFPSSGKLRLDYAAQHLSLSYGGNALPAIASKEEPEPVDLAALDLKLSEQLINRNFSNYSAWHLRALLQQAPPRDSSAGEADLHVQIDPAKELEWVQQGIYTEPNDQSIWLYHHWLTLLGRGCERLRVTHTAILQGELYVFFSGSACARGEDGSTQPAAVVNIRCGEAVPAWQDVPGVLVPLGAGGLSHNRTRQLPSTRRRWTAAWKFAPQSGAEFSASIAAANVQEVSIEVSIEVQGTHATGVPARGWRRLSFSGPPLLCDADSSPSQATHPSLAAFSSPEQDPTRAELLEGELARVEELLDIEPDCKWALLSKSRLASACAAGSGVAGLKAAEESCMSGYDQICALDPLRRGFYLDARADCMSRLGVLSWLSSGCGMNAPLNLRGLALKSLVTTTMLAAFGVRIINVEENKLKTFGPLLLLVSLEELRASKNELVGNVTEAFCLPRLRRLDVSHNNMELRGGAAMRLPECLQEVDVSNNPAVLALAGPVATTAGVEQLDGPRHEDTLLGRLLEDPNKSCDWSVECNVDSGRCLLSRTAAKPSENNADA